jgi:hypothetical protein
MLFDQFSRIVALIVNFSFCEEFNIEEQRCQEVGS